MAKNCEKCGCPLAEREGEYFMSFAGVNIGKEIYTIIEKDDFVLEELENTWVIKARKKLSN